jgi:hypothetical protein
MRQASDSGRVHTEIFGVTSPGTPGIGPAAAWPPHPLAMRRQRDHWSRSRSGLTVR